MVIFQFCDTVKFLFYRTKIFYLDEFSNILKSYSYWHYHFLECNPLTLGRHSNNFQANFGYFVKFVLFVPDCWCNERKYQPLVFIWTNFTNPTVHLSHIAQYIIRNCNVHISVLKGIARYGAGALWDLWIRSMVLTQWSLGRFGCNC